MENKIKVISERVDDIPLLLAEIDRMGLTQIMDIHFPSHGNWAGLNLGAVSSIWLSHILSEGDHRLNHVQGWAEHRLESLSRCIGTAVRGLDFSDDRLGVILNRLSKDDPWDEFERELNRRVLRVYDLYNGQPIRLDSTSAAGYWRVEEGGLFQLGHSKDHRPDLPQVKVMLSSLDPLGMPLCTTVVSGQQADDPLYIPAMVKVQQSFQQKGLLFIGDAKMAALATRAFVVKQQNYYLCPLPKQQLSDAILDGYLQAVWEGRQPLSPICHDTGETEKIAEGYQLRQTQAAEIDGEEIHWQERRLVVRSLKLAESGKATLDKRLQQTQARLLKFNERQQGKKCYRSQEELRPQVENILRKSQMQELLTVEYHQQGSIRTLRKYKNKPERISDQREVTISVTVNQIAYQDAVKHLGWRVYATNADEKELPFSRAILAYRSEFLIERNFGRLKGKPLSLRPMYLQTEERIIGLIRLLSIALRVLGLIEYQLRQQLEKQQTVLRGLFQGNPKRETATPTTEQVLKAFRYITLTIIYQQQHIIYHLTELNELQNKILGLLNLSISIYSKLAGEFLKPG